MATISCPVAALPVVDRELIIDLRMDVDELLCAIC